MSPRWIISLILATCTPGCSMGELDGTPYPTAEISSDAVLVSSKLAKQTYLPRKTRATRPRKPPEDSSPQSTREGTLERAYRTSQPRCRRRLPVELDVLQDAVKKGEVPEDLRGALTLPQARSLGRILRARDLCRRFRGEDHMRRLKKRAGVRSIHGDRGFWSQRTTLVLASGTCLELAPRSLCCVHS